MAANSPKFSSNSRVMVFVDFTTRGVKQNHGQDRGSVRRQEGAAPGPAVDCSTPRPGSEFRDGAGLAAVSRSLLHVHPNMHVRVAPKIPNHGRPFDLPYVPHSVMSHV